MIDFFLLPRDPRDPRLFSAAYRISPHTPVFYNIPPIYAGQFSLFLYYVRSVSPLSCFSSGTSDFLRFVRLHETFITRQHCFLQRYFDHFKSQYKYVQIKRKEPYARLSSGKTRKGKNEKVERNKKENYKTTKKKHCFR